MILNKIYFSPTGGTKKVTDILADEWNCQKTEIDLTVPDTKYEEIIFTEDDVCMIAIPVFEGRVPKTAVTRLKKMKGNRSTAIMVAVYGARAVDDAMIELKDILEEQGFCCRAGIFAIAEHSILHIYGQGRPDDNDRAKLKEFSKEIKEKYLSGSLSDSVCVPGNRPYTEMGGMPYTPTANESCILCGKCAADCPAEAIPKDNPRATDPEKCIFCMRCVVKCPTHARDFDPNLIRSFQEKMAPVFAGERHNELFL